MGWLFGRFEHQLDEKGRVILPSKIRAHFSDIAFLTPHLEGCLGLWTPGEFEPEIAKRRRDEDAGPRERNLLRDWSSQVSEVSLDKQGRMALSGELRSYAGLDREVVIVGMIDHVELWSPDRWTSRDSAGETGGRSSGTPSSSRSGGASS